MTVTLHARNGGPAFRLNNLQVALVAAALQTVGAQDRDLFAPAAYVPSGVCGGWSDALFAVLSDLLLVEVWDRERAQLRPRALWKRPVDLEHGSRRRRGPAPDPWAGLPPYAERTPLMQTPFGPVVLALASWWGTCGGCTVDPG